MVIAGSVLVMVPDIIYNKMSEVIGWTPVKEEPKANIAVHMRPLSEIKEDNYDD
jgi:hypothetical protein